MYIVLLVKKEDITLNKNSWWNIIYTIIKIPWNDDI